MHFMHNFVKIIFTVGSFFTHIRILKQNDANNISSQNIFEKGQQMITMQTLT